MLWKGSEKFKVKVCQLKLVKDMHRVFKFSDEL